MPRQKGRSKEVLLVGGSNVYFWKASHLLEGTFS